MGAIPPLGVPPSSLRSPSGKNSDHFSSCKTNDTTRTLSLLEFVSGAPFKNKGVRSLTKSGLAPAPCANSCLFSVGCLLNQLAEEKGHVLSLPPKSSVLGSLSMSGSSLFHPTLTQNAMIRFFKVCLAAAAPCCLDSVLCRHSSH